MTSHEEPGDSDEKVLDHPRYVRFALSRIDLDVLELAASIGMDSFAGSAWAYIGNETMARFADELTPYPLVEPARLTAGHGPNETTGSPARELIGIEVCQVDAFGSLVALVHLDDEHARHGAELRIGMPTTYEQVRRFVVELRRMVRDETGEAVLAGVSRASASEA